MLPTYFQNLGFLSPNDRFSTGDLLISGKFRKDTFNSQTLSVALEPNWLLVCGDIILNSAVIPFAFWFLQSKLHSSNKLHS